MDEQIHMSEENNISFTSSKIKSTAPWYCKFILPYLFNWINLELYLICVVSVYVKTRCHDHHPEPCSSSWYVWHLHHKYFTHKPRKLKANTNTNNGRMLTYLKHSRFHRQTQHRFAIKLHNAAASLASRASWFIYRGLVTRLKGNVMRAWCLAQVPPFLMTRVLWDVLLQL